MPSPSSPAHTGKASGAAALLPAASIQSPPSLPPKPTFTESITPSSQNTLNQAGGTASRDSRLDIYPLAVSTNPPGASSNGEVRAPSLALTDIDDMPAYLSISSGSPVEGGSFTPRGLPPMRKTISMTLCGERVHYDLSTLEDDPATIIRLLKMSASDRDNWMIIASSYRRAGKLHAAILVVSKMLDVMKVNGILEEDLRPAFLMLASCYTELRRRTVAFHGKETDESRVQHERARSWLQKVHGHTGLGSNPTDTIASTITPASPAFSRALASRPMAGKLVKREMQLLRDQQISHLTQLAEIIAGKRKADDSIMQQERSRRRRLEQEKQELEKQLAMAQEREQRALEQVHDEMVARLTAEERAQEEEQKRIQAQNGVSPLLEALSAVLSRAASGGDVAQLTAGILQAIPPTWD
ncbi:hypothetical protein K488DRAFT_88514 [Vararia minispora EC-137]|uniref:Uncharacterized protein n=1 Tax=Vararia minispora EC-137 TaxID=1314806 RepID=A0ACB8QDG4_9AGAM|nr:hypothetical protein K488DRAFT_88514 [Vararia minispora EC-137]